MDPIQQKLTVLVVDDDPDLRRLVAYTLEFVEGLAVASASSAQEALDWIGKHGLPHLAVVDIMMPGMSGLDFSREVQRFSDLPVILLTAVHDDEIVVRSIEELAEDYVKKPFNPRELSARVKRVLRRIGDFAFASAPITHIDPSLSIDFAHQTALVSDRLVPLTPIESKLLHILTRSARRTVRTDYLLRRVWPLEEVFEDTLRVHIHRLRQKIEPVPAEPKYLLTQRGMGYSFLPVSPGAEELQLAGTRPPEYNTGLPHSWGSSSAGRAPRSQRGGRGFESLLLHQIPARSAGR